MSQSVLLRVACVAIIFVLVTGQIPQFCVIWGDPHLTRFPSFAGEYVPEVWCQERGTHWLLRNRYVMISITVGNHPYLILDFNMVIFNENNTIACTLDHNIFGYIPACVAGTNMSYSNGNGYFTFSYLPAEFSVTIRRDVASWLSNELYYSFSISQSSCMVKVSDGLCKTGCNPVTGAALRGRRAVTDSSPVTEQTRQNAAEICDVFVNNFVNRAPAGLIKQQIDNARSACITDMSATGNVAIGGGAVNVMAVQVAMANATSIKELAGLIANSMAQMSAIANETNSQSENQVQQIINPINNNSTVFRWSMFETASSVCATSNINMATSQYLHIYALVNSVAGCGPIYARSLLTLGEVDRILAGRRVISAYLSLYGASANETEQTPFQFGSEYGLNEVSIQRVISPWSSATTYRSRPATTTSNQRIIPGTRLTQLYNVTIDITSLVQDMRAGGQSNYGIQLMLQTESRYRAMTFCSPLHPDVKRRPKLVVTTDGI